MTDIDFYLDLEVAEKEWEEFLVTHPEASFLQSWGWGEFHEQYSHQIWRRGWRAAPNQPLQGVMLMVSEPAKRGRYVTIPGGPIIDWSNPSLVNAVMSEIKNIARADKAVFVRMRPQLSDTIENRQLVENLGWQKAPMHLHAELTHRLRVDRDETEILAQMRKSTRYEIKKAQRLGVEIKETTAPSALQRFYQVQLETAKRQGFTPFGEEFLTKQFEVLAARDEAKLYEAYYQGEYLAGAIIIFYHDEAVYHYGVGAAAGRKYPGAYLIQWQAILEAKRRGGHYYNFWGVAPEGDDQHRFASLSVFKRGFGGEDHAYLPAHDLVMEPMRYLVAEGVEQIRKKIRRV